MLKIGLIGYGYWGPNLARNFNTHPQCKLIRIADARSQRRAVARSTFKNSDIVSSSRKVTRGKDIDVVAIATPVDSHFSLALDAIEQGKHVWIEKPLVSSYEQGLRLKEAAKRKKSIVMVDHTFLFTSAVQRMRQMIRRGDLGRLYYYDSTRVNLGLFQHDVSVIWDLAVHDFSIMDYLLGDNVRSVHATGSKHFPKSPVDMAYITAQYDRQLIAHLSVNWLSPVKIRQTMIGGDKKMMVWNHLEPDEPLKIYDRGVRALSKEGLYGIMHQYRIGDVHAPTISRTEALQNEIQYFVECIQKKKNPHNGIDAGLRIVRLLEAAEQSVFMQGKPIEIKPRS